LNKNTVKNRVKYGQKTGNYTVADKLTTIWRNKHLYILLIPGILFFIIFRYIPLYFNIIVFMDYNPYQGVTGSPWVGFEHFINLFTDPYFFRLLSNTLIISILNLVFFFPLPIIIALLLNELRSNTYKRVIQSIIYIPHFISMVIVASITYVFLTTSGGILNEIFVMLGMEKIPFLTDPNWFRPMIVLQTIWKETGWGTIIFLAAIAGIDPALYEAAVMDGASRATRMFKITLPLMMPTIIIMLILQLGRILSTGFEQIFLMRNSINVDVAEVFDTFVYYTGLKGGQFSFATAISLFKSVVGLILVIFANKLARKYSDTSLY
jgi:putative aldouronate transport system permease protein